MMSRDEQEFGVNRVAGMYALARTVSSLLKGAVCSVQEQQAIIEELRSKVATLETMTGRGASAATDR